MVPAGRKACAMPDRGPTVRQARRSSATASIFRRSEKRCGETNVRSRVVIFCGHGRELLVIRSPASDQSSFAPWLPYPEVKAPARERE